MAVHCLHAMSVQPAVVTHAPGITHLPGKVDLRRSLVGIAIPPKATHIAVLTLASVSPRGGRRL